MTGDSGRPRLEARQTYERPHVLLVTDDPDLSEFLVEGLPHGGFWVSVIASGLQALEVFRLRQFDLVAIDAGMQTFDAIELVRRLRGRSSLDRGHEARTQAPIILIDSTDSGQPGTSPEEPGVARVLVAPLELAEVVRILHEVFQAWRQDHPDAPLADSAAARAF
jgi:CheY-like chemotaxis protein